MEAMSINNSANINKTIYLIRHGETDFNKKGIIQGSGINSDLNETGRTQAELFYNKYQTVPFDCVYTSLLKRTHQSVASFIQKHPHKAIAELNEINWGIMEGVEQTPERVAHFESIVKQWQSGELDTAVADGETPLEMFERQKIGLAKIMAQTEEENILICMHGRAMRSFLCLLTNTPLQDMEKWGHSNLCLYVLKFNGTCFDVVEHNQTAHLLG
jgi:2,3-bisphosphoglycerate-dependent phosphoglycerate mutase